MAYEDEIEQKITGSTFEECKEKLFNLYGKNFRIINKVTDFRPGGFLYLKKKPVTIVTYIVTHQKSYSPDNERMSYVDRDAEAEQLARNREAILQQTGANSTVIINKVSQEIEDLKKDLSQQLKQISA